VTLAPRIGLGLLQGRSFSESLSPEAARDLYIPISRETGEFTYLTARVGRARRIVEFGTSFGVSTVYLAAAVEDNGGGLVTSTEIEPTKAARAVENLAEAGLADVSEVLVGDALETLADLDDAVDLVLLDGWKDLYLPVLELLTPRLRPGAVVLADNIHTFRRSMRPYVRHVQSGDHGFVSTTLSIGSGYEYSVFVGP
jgi:predicted O-methyltransferase YrrM